MSWVRRRSHRRVAEAAVAAGDTVVAVAGDTAVEWVAAEWDMVADSVAAEWVAAGLLMSPWDVPEAPADSLRSIQWGFAAAGLS